MYDVVRTRGGSRIHDAALPDSSIYSREYLLSSALDGLSDYLAGGLNVVRRREIDLLGVSPGLRVLDLGCGRGETSAEILRRGGVVTALDYSRDAVILTRELIGAKGHVVQADGTSLPFASASFDRVLMSDVIEHVPWSLATQLLFEVQRVLVPGGRALVHTAPNTWFIAVVKRPLSWVLRVFDRQAAIARFAEYDRLREAMHPNELNPLRLRRLMREAGAEAQTWIDRDVLRSGSSEWTLNWPESLVRWVGVLAGTWPLRLLLGNDMFALITSNEAPVRERSGTARRGRRSGHSRG